MFQILRTVKASLVSSVFPAWFQAKLARLEQARKRSRLKATARSFGVPATQVPAPAEVAPTEPTFPEHATSRRGSHKGYSAGYRRTLKTVQKGQRRAEKVRARKAKKPPAIHVEIRHQIPEVSERQSWGLLAVGLAVKLLVAGVKMGKPEAAVVVESSAALVLGCWLPGVKYAIDEVQHSSGGTRSNLNGRLPFGAPGKPTPSVKKEDIDFDDSDESSDVTSVVNVEKMGAETAITRSAPEIPSSKKGSTAMVPATDVTVKVREIEILGRLQKKVPGFRQDRVEVSAETGVDESLARTLSWTDAYGFLGHLQELYKKALSQAGMGHKDARQRAREMAWEFRVEMPGWMDRRTTLDEALRFLYAEPREVVGPGSKNGGYRLLGFMEELPEVRALKCKLPRISQALDSSDSAEPFLYSLQKRVDQRGCVVAWAGDDQVTWITCKDGKWLEPLTRLGMCFFQGDKMQKRLRTLTRLFAITAKFPADQVRVRLFESKEIRHLLTEELDDSRLEKCLDGISLMRHSFYLRCVAQHAKELVHQGKLREAQKLGRRVKHCLTLNGRFFHPDLRGHLKTQFLVVPDKMLDRHWAGYDIVSPEMNDKIEITSPTDGYCYLGLEPQEAKDQAQTNVQYLVNARQLFPLADLKAWALNRVRDVFYRIMTDEVLKDAHCWLINEAWLESEGVKAVDTNFALAQVAAVGEMEHDEDNLDHEYWVPGWSFANSPGMTERIFNGLARRMNSHDKGRINIPIPCSRECQVLPRLTFALAGVDIVELEQEQILYARCYGTAVVNDLEWCDMVVRHGGCDLDDHFVLVCRKVDGRHLVYVLRSPNGLGEWSLLEAVDPDQWPTSRVYHRKDGTPTGLDYEMVSWPEVNAEDLELPKQIDRALADGDTRRLEVPVENAGGKKEVKAYTVDDFMRSVKRELGGANPGGLVNPMVLQWLVMGFHLPVSLGMETAIDGSVQSSSVKALETFREYSKVLLETVVDCGLPIDRWYWQSKEFDRKLGEGKQLPEGRLVDGPLTQIVKYIDGLLEQAQKSLRTMAQKRHVMHPRAAAMQARLSGGEAKGLTAVVKDWRIQVAQVLGARKAALENREALRKQAREEKKSLKRLVAEIEDRYQAQLESKREILIRGFTNHQGQFRIGKLVYMLNHLRTSGNEETGEPGKISDIALYDATFIKATCAFLNGGPEVCDLSDLG